MSYNKSEEKPKDSQGNRHDDHDLHEPIDWMVYSHKQLYDMVHTGVNLAGAQSAASNWKAIAEAIAMVRNNLHKAVEDSTDGWESESARLARDGLFKVTDWVDDTAKHALKVSECISNEANNVEAARAAMPPPPETPVTPVPQPAPPVRLIDRPNMMDRSAAMFGIETDHLREARLAATETNQFAGFAGLGQTPVEQLAAADASHRAAADVMAAFQRNSAAVDQTVPAQFAPPVNPVNPVLTDTTGGTKTPTPLPDGSGGGGAGPVGTPPPAGRGTTNTSGSGRGGAGGGYGRGGFGGGMGGSRTFMPPAASSGGAGGGGGAMSGGGSSNVVNESSRAGGAAAAAAAGGGGQTKAFQNPLAMGGAPMAAPPPAAAGGRADEREHKHASYLEEDDNIFGLDRKAAPPVIGQ